MYYVHKRSIFEPDADYAVCTEFAYLAQFLRLASSIQVSLVAENNDQSNMIDLFMIEQYWL